MTPHAYFIICRNILADCIYSFIHTYKAVDAWKILIESNIQNAYMPEGKMSNWITFFGKEDKTPQPSPTAGDDQLGIIFSVALGSRNASYSPYPTEYEKLEFECKIILQLKRGKSGGYCG